MVYREAGKFAQSVRWSQSALDLITPPAPAAASSDSLPAVADGASGDAKAAARSGSAKRQRTLEKSLDEDSGGDADSFSAAPASSQESPPLRAQLSRWIGLASGGRSGDADGQAAKELNDARLVSLLSGMKLMMPAILAILASSRALPAASSKHQCACLVVAVALRSFSFSR
jgi:hypothetical protein